METKIKIPSISPKDNSNPVFKNQELFNQLYINNLTRLLKTNLSVPTYIPRKFIDCFYLYWDGSTTYKLYIYINNSWKSTTLS